MNPKLVENILHGWERTTGMGASHSARILCEGGEWFKLSNFPEALFEGREEGYLHYSLPIAPEEIWAYFYRSNGGREEVTVYQGNTLIETFGSFDRAKIWGQTRQVKAQA